MPAVPNGRTRLLARWRVALSTIVHVVSLPWAIWYCIRNRCNPIVLVYVNARTPGGLGMVPSQSKDALFRIIQRHDPVLASRYPGTVLVPDSAGTDDRIEIVRTFMRQSGVRFPMVAKPDTGSRSFGAYRVDGERGLRHLLERTEGDYLVQQHCPGPVEAGLFLLRSGADDGPPQYGVAIKRDAYVTAAQPHPELASLRAHFLCDDVTSRLTPELRAMIDAFAEAVRCDMGRLDVCARTIEALFAEPWSLQVLEINVGFTAADFHVTDLRHSFAARVRMTANKWTRALALGAAHYAATPEKMRASETFVRCLRQGVRLGSAHQAVYRSRPRT
jgi:hypothetical protein